MFVYKVQHILYPGDELGLSSATRAEEWDAELKGEKRLSRLAVGSEIDKGTGKATAK
jgi:hypothetical protein